MKNRRRRRRRRQGLDEERKRELRYDLRDYFLWSKNLALTDAQDQSLGFGGENDSEAATATADRELDPQALLERARKFGYNFADVSVLPPAQSGKQSTQSPSQQAEESKRDAQETTQTALPQEEKQESAHQPEKDGVKSEQEEQEQNFSPYSQYVLEQMQQAQEEPNEPLYSEQVQYLVDLPAALESDNRDTGHSIKAFADPFLILKELLWMAGRQNPELEVIQRLWLVWTKWYTYYHAWSLVVRDEYRYLPGTNSSLSGDRQQGDYQYRGIHQLETYHLENSILQVMRWEFAHKSELEKQFNPIPNLHQLHGYFVGLRRRYWDSTSWQYRVNLGAKLTLQEDDDEELEFTTEE